MKIARLAFLAIVCCVFCMNDSLAGCGAGNYWYTAFHTCKSCPKNCYCNKAPSDYTDSAFLYCDPNGSKPIRNAGNIKKGGGDPYHYLNIYTCPTSYPSTNDSGKSSSGSCYGSFSCSAKKYVKAYSGSCSEDCTAGYKCTGGTYTVYYDSNGGRTGCSKGTYSGKGQSSCTDCAAGTYSGDYASSCTACPAGTSAGKGQGKGSCTECAVGNCASKDGSCIGGSNTGATSCMACPKGTYQDSKKQTSCKDCGPGKCTSKDNKTCSSETGLTYCISCTPGTFSSGSKNTSCSNCTGNTYTDSSTGYTECKQCTGSGKGIQDGDHKKCDTCKDGYYANGGICEECPVGAKCSGGIKTNCDATKGEYQDVEGQKNCKTVPDGQYLEDNESPPVPCTNANQYIDGKMCKFCSGLKTIPSGAGFYKDPNKEKNESKSECRYGIAQSHCRVIYDGKYAVIYKYNGTDDYVLDSEHTPTAEKDYYVEGGECKSCADVGDGTKKYSPGNKKGSEQCYACLPGSCFVSGSNDCMVCSAGYACPGLKGAAQECKYTPSNSSDYGIGPYGVEACTGDSFSKPGQTSCTDCAVGYTTSGVTGNCKLLPEKDDNGNVKKDSNGKIKVYLQSSPKPCRWSSTNGNALDESADNIDEMCVKKIVNICYFSGNPNQTNSSFQCNPTFSWPERKDFDIGRADMSVIKKQYKTYNTSGVVLNPEFNQY